MDTCLVYTLLMKFQWSLIYFQKFRVNTILYAFFKEVTYAYQD